MDAKFCSAKFVFVFVENFNKNNQLGYYQHISEVVYETNHWEYTVVKLVQPLQLPE